MGMRVGSMRMRVGCIRVILLQQRRCCARFSASACLYFYIIFNYYFFLIFTKKLKKNARSSRSWRSHALVVEAEGLMHKQ
jgi:hypothetical protein